MTVGLVVAGIVGSVFVAGIPGDAWRSTGRPRSTDGRRLVDGANLPLAAHHHTVAWLTEHSDAVVYGQVRGTTARWENGRIVTDVAMHVRDRILGTTDEDIVFSHEGGSVKGVGMRVFGGAHFEPEEHVVVFLAQTQLGHRLVGREDGRMSVRTDASSGEATVRWMCPGCTEATPTPLSQFIEHVRRGQGSAP
jgi:hypothetical protein